MASSRRSALDKILLPTAVLVALGLANSRFAPYFEVLWRGAAHHAINHGLMALFFLLVGLELKRELSIGRLQGRKRAALPVAAAAGGFIVPVALYLIAAGGEYSRGWAVPASTDTAFAIAVAGMLGRHAPARLRVFLSAFAIFDDVVAVFVISVFYADRISAGRLAAVGLAFAFLLAVNRAGVRSIVVYLLLGLVTWAAMWRSGIHASVAGLLVALTVPLHGEDSPLVRLEHGLEPWVAWGVLPLFAFANSGIELPEDLWAVARHPVSVGIALGLVIGKPAGILASVWGAVRLGWAEAPRGVTASQLAGAAFLSGIGFTMLIFIATIAFGDDPDVSLDDAKLAVLCASVISAAIGAGVLVAAGRAPRGLPARRLRLSS